MASVDDIEELIATRKLNGLNDNLYKNETMSEEAFNEIIDNFEVVTYLTEYGRRGIKENVKRLQKENEEKDKYIKHSEEITTEMNEDINKLLIEIKEKDKQIEEVLNLIFEFGQIDGDHHKAWVIDQIVKILTKDKYDEWVRNYVYDEETGDTYSWYKGIAP